MRKSLLSIAGAAVFAAAPMAQADDNAQLRAELAEVRSQLAQIQQDQNQNWLNERRAQEVKGLINEVLSDADTRATLLQDGMTAGYDGSQFFLASADGSFRMNIGGQLQIRYTYNNRRDVTSNASNTNKDNTAGFGIRRAKLDFDGHIGDPRIGYHFRIDGDQNGGDVNVQIAKVSYQVNDWINVYAGRLKSPFSRDELMSSRRQIAAERSLVDNQFSWGYTEGAGVVVQPIEQLKVDFMINNGPNSGGSNFNSGSNITTTIPGGIAPGFVTLNNNSSFALSTRAEVLLMGEWNQFRDYSSWSGDELGVMLGGAVGYIQDYGADFAIAGFPIAPAPGVWGNAFTWTVDLGVQWNGFSFAAAGYGRHLLPNDDSIDNLNQFGALAQAAYNINDTIEPFVRYEYIDMDGWGGLTGDEDMHVLTLGANYFIKKHSAKFTLDMIYLFQAPGDTGVAVNSGQGLLGSTRSGEFAIRGQFQLLF